jgi:hypothetical protein
LRNWYFDPLPSRKLLARMIALHGLPLILVEYDGFRKFVASLNPLFNPISRTTSRNDCMKEFKEQKVALQGMFKDAKSRCSLTMWKLLSATSIECQIYQILTDQKEKVQGCNCQSWAPCW